MLTFFTILLVISCVALVVMLAQVVYLDIRLYSNRYDLPEIILLIALILFFAGAAYAILRHLSGI